MSKVYQRVENADIMMMVAQALNDSGCTFNVASVKTGNTKVQFRFTLDEKYVVNGDMISPQIIVTNAEVAGTALRINLGFYRFVCANGMVLGTDLYNEKIIHRKGKTFDVKFNDIEHQIAAVLEYLRTDFVQDVEEQTSKTVSFEEGISIIGNLNIPSKSKDSALETWAMPSRKQDSYEDVFCLWNIVNEQSRNTVDSAQARTVYNQTLLRDINDLLDMIDVNLWTEKVA